MAIPIPARAASQAASILPTTSLDCTGTSYTFWSRVKVQDFGDSIGTKLMQSWPWSSSGVRGVPRASRYSGLAQTTR